MLESSTPATESNVKNVDKRIEQSIALELPDLQNMRRLLEAMQRQNDLSEGRVPRTSAIRSIEIADLQNEIHATMKDFMYGQCNEKFLILLLPLLIEIKERHPHV